MLKASERLEKHYRYRTSIKGFFWQRVGLFQTEKKKDLRMRLRSSWLRRGGEPQMLLFSGALSLKMTNNERHPKKKKKNAECGFSCCGFGASRDVKQYVLHHKAAAAQLAERPCLHLQAPPPPLPVLVVRNYTQTISRFFFLPVVFKLTRLRFSASHYVLL